MKPSTLLTLQAFQALERETLEQISSSETLCAKISLSKKLTSILEAQESLVCEMAEIKDAGESDHLSDAMKYAAESFKAKTINHLDDHFRMALKNQMVSLPPTSFRGFDPGALNKCSYCDSEIPGIDDRKDWPEQRSEIGICLPCWSEMDNPPALPDSPGFKEEKSQIIKKVAKKKTSSKKSNPKLPKTTSEACDHLEHREA